MNCCRDKTLNCCPVETNGDKAPASAQYSSWRTSWSITSFHITESASLQCPLLWNLTPAPHPVLGWAVYPPSCLPCMLGCSSRVTERAQGHGELGHEPVCGVWEERRLLGESDCYGLEHWSMLAGETVTFSYCSVLIDVFTGRTVLMLKTATCLSSFTSTVLQNLHCNWIVLLLALQVLLFLFLTATTLIPQCFTTEAIFLICTERVLSAWYCWINPRLKYLRDPSGKWQEEQKGLLKAIRFYSCWIWGEKVQEELLGYCCFILSLSQNADWLKSCDLFNNIFTQLGESKNIF